MKGKLIFPNLAICLATLVFILILTPFMAFELYFNWQSSPDRLNLKKESSEYRFAEQAVFQVMGVSSRGFFPFDSSVLRIIKIQRLPDPIPCESPFYTNDIKGLEA